MLVCVLSDTNRDIISYSGSPSFFIYVSNAHPGPGTALAPRDLGTEALM